MDDDKLSAKLTQIDGQIAALQIKVELIVRLLEEATMLDSQRAAAIRGAKP